MLLFSALSTRRATAVAVPISAAVRTKTNPANIPRIAEAIQEACRAVLTARANGTIIVGSTQREQRGANRNRANCFPLPCSSMTVVTRTDPNGPRATSRSHWSYSPPRTTRAPVARRPASSERSQSSCARQCSFHIFQIWRRGHAQPPSGRRRHGLRP